MNMELYNRYTGCEPLIVLSMIMKYGDYPQRIDIDGSLYIKQVKDDLRGFNGLARLIVPEKKYKEEKEIMSEHKSIQKIRDVKKAVLSRIRIGQTVRMVSGTTDVQDTRLREMKVIGMYPHFVIFNVEGTHKESFTYGELYSLLNKSKKLAA